MQGIIPRSFINSVDGVVPDETGNVSLGAITSVNIELVPDSYGNVDVTFIYCDGRGKALSIPFDSDEKTFNLLQAETTTQTDMASVFIRREEPPAFGWEYRRNGGDPTTALIYDTLNPPPYPVTSVNGETGDVYVTKLVQADSQAGAGGLTVLSNGMISDLVTYKEEAEGQPIGKIRLDGENAINQVPKLSVFDSSLNTSSAVILTSDRFKCSLSGTTLNITWTGI